MKRSSGGPAYFAVMGLGTEVREPLVQPSDSYTVLRRELLSTTILPIRNSNLPFASSAEDLRVSIGKFAFDTLALLGRRMFGFQTLS